MPVEAENEEGELSKVDLSLEKTQEGWIPVNPLVEVTVGESASEGVEIGDEGLTVTQAGAEENSTAEPLGDKNLWFSEVEEGSDTDLLVSPTSMGVELFDMLRSADSPETLHFHVDLPEGAELKPNGGGGAEVLGSDGSILAVVPTPTAVDAQGTSIPTKLEVEGDSIALHVEHREAEAAYPVLLDPSILQDWYNATGTTTRTFRASTPGAGRTPRIPTGSITAPATPAGRAIAASASPLSPPISPPASGVSTTTLRPMEPPTWPTPGSIRSSATTADAAIPIPIPSLTTMTACGTKRRGTDS